LATNVYFSQKVKAEQDLYEDIVIESLKMYGQDVYYLPREVVNEDSILGEDIESVFSDAYIIEMYIANVDGFEGDGNLLSKFGVEIRDQANFIVSKKRWNQYIGTRSSGTLGNIRPGEGDLIYLPLSKSLFEIRFVEHESPFYQLSNLPTYTLQCELFEYSGEQIQTGISDIDTAMEDISQQIVMVINNSNGTDFTIGETIQQEIGSSGEYVTARVVSYETVDSSTKKLFVTGWATTDGEYHEFTTDTIDGQTSSAEWTVTDVYNIDDPIANRALTTDPQSRNQEFEVEADGIIDFSESNPFGELGG
jgi:hypothetical protein